MVEAGILDGDFALIQRTDVAREGQIVVALIDENEATLKYFRREGPKVRLDPANSAYEPQIYAPRQVRIQGKQIGRASCRERVCQYVSITVVAVSLKNKNIVAIM